jgi:hypothetical protein
MYTPHHPTHYGFCPTCRQETRFQYLGEQRYPERVAQKLNINPVVMLWRCENCHTTMSENELELAAE